MSSNPEEEGVLRSPAGFAEEIAEYETTVRRAVSSGQLLTAIEVAKDGLHRFPDNLTLRQQLALAQTQAGALGLNYFMAYMIFGTLSLTDAQRSLRLFRREVMPALTKL